MKKELFYKQFDESELELQKFLKNYSHLCDELYHINDSYRTNHRIRKISAQKAIHYRINVNIDEIIDVLNDFKNKYLDKQIELLQKIQNDPFVQYE
jgi:hypothetical protein